MSNINDVLPLYLDTSVAENKLRSLVIKLGINKGTLIEVGLMEDS